jgi:hypothetical protein
MTEPERRARSPWRVLLVVPFVMMLWVPLFNSVEPRLLGIPFFYWYQLVGIFAGAALTGIVYFATRHEEP